MTRTLRIALFTIFNLIVAGNLLAQPIPVDDLSDSSACSPGISCTLRGAILFSEGNGVPDTIVFDDSITGGTISLLTTLPPITEQLEIDATSNANYAGSPLFFIDGSGVTGNGLEFISGSDNSRVKGLAIGGFSAGNAIQISDTSGVRIESSWIGTDTTGTAPHPNVIGVAVFNSSDVIIGGSDVGKRNVIVNNTASGIDLSSTNSCKVSANFIGISADTNTIGANFTGISSMDGVQLTIGGLTEDERNVISGNNSFGIALEGPSAAGQTGATIQGNYLGTTVSGGEDVPNGDANIRLEGSNSNTIGGTSSAARNVISGCAGNGIEIENGVNNTIAGNFIGTDANGTAAIANGVGIFLTDATNTLIGGTIQTESSNVISGNQRAIRVSCSANGAGTSNLIRGNFIGSTADGSASLPNTQGGVLIDGCNQTFVGGALSEGNLITGTLDPDKAYVEVRGGVANEIKSNLLGLNITGDGSLTLEGIGVLLKGTTSTAVGGDGVGNAIGGLDVGVVVTGGESAAQAGVNNSILGNSIGTNRSADRMLSNDIGILITSSGFTGPENSVSGTVIGGSGNNRNFVSGNLAEGIKIEGNQVADVSIQGNLIGIDGQNTFALENGSHGIRTLSPSAVVTVGTEVGNVIAFNQGSGILVEAGKLEASRNSIYSNFEEGIDLIEPAEGGESAEEGVTENDSDDSDTGPNDLQNFPEFIVRKNAKGATVAGRLRSKPSQQYRIEFFRNESADSSGYGEGKEFLEAIDVTTNSKGVATFSEIIELQDRLNEVESIAATATDSQGQTSEFSISNTTESAFNRGERLANPPAVFVEDDDVTLTLKKFAVPKAEAALLEEEALAARRRGSAGPGIEYQVTIKNNATQNVTKKKSKRNVVTVKNLPPGTYSSSYQITLKNGKKVVSKSKKSPDGSFEVAPD